MIDPREPLHQPPNPDDLRRVPPANPECARVRGMMRDFADGDLTAEAHRLVEEHAHRCKVCSVELSRAEHEVVRLRRAFGSVREQGGSRVPPLGRDFAARVVDRLMLDETSAGHVGGGGLSPRGVAELRSAVQKAASSERGGTPVAFRQWASWQRAWRSRPLRAALFAAATILLLVLGSVALWFDGGDGAPGRIARLVVTRASGTYGLDGRRLGSGDGLGESQFLSVGAGGSAKIDWHDVSALTQPAATLEMRGVGHVSMHDGAPVLLQGTMHVETHRPVTLAVADGSELQLGIGEYVIAADSFDGLDANSALPLDPLASAPAGLRVEVEVLRGDATITRSDIGPTLVAAGTVGVYQSGTGVAIRPSGMANPVANVSPRAIPAPVAPTQPILVASVHERSGVPSVGTQLSLIYAGNAASQSSHGTTNANGALVLAPEVGCESDFMIVQAIPAVSRLELGLRAPDAYPVLRNGAEARCASQLVLDVAAPVSSTVLDGFGNPQHGVRIIPCIVDELFGTMWPWDGGQVWTDSEGQFVIHRLPASLPPHQHMVLLCGKPGLKPAVVPIPVRGSPLALQPMAPIVLSPLEAVKLHWLPAYTTIHVIEEVEGLPPGSAAWQRTFTTDQFGRVPLALVGRKEAMYLRSGSESNPMLRKFEIDALGPPPTYHAAPTHVPLGSLFEPLEPLLGSDLLLASAYRHQNFVVATPENVGAGAAMVLNDSLGRSVSAAHVFSMTPTGPRGRAVARFLGFTSPTGVISLAGVEQGTDLAVIAPDGAVAFHASPQQSLVSMQVRALGRVIVDAPLRPSGNAADSLMAIRFERNDAALPGMVQNAWRFASETNGWEVGDLPPGMYKAHFIQPGLGPSTRLMFVPEAGFAVLQ